MLYSAMLSCPLKENNTTSDCDDCIVRGRHRLLHLGAKTRDPRPHSKCNMPSCVAVCPVGERGGDRERRLIIHEEATK